MADKPMGDVICWPFGRHLTASIRNLTSQKVNLSSGTRNGNETYAIRAHYVAMSSTNKAIGERLQRIKKALDLSGQEMARLVGVTPGNWSDFERGKRRISLNAALRLYAETGIDPNFVYLGIVDRMPHKLAIKIGELAA